MTNSVTMTNNNSNLKEYIHDQILKDVIEGTLQPIMILHEKKTHGAVWRQPFSLYGKP